MVIPVLEYVANDASYVAMPRSGWSAIILKIERVNNRVYISFVIINEQLCDQLWLDCGRITVSKY